jgi:hypothetical protein
MGLLLTSCAKESSKGSSCGVLFEYNEDTQKRMLEEAIRLRTDPEYRVLPSVLDNYQVTRESIRNCQDGKENTKGD